jgi:hypothetical protein
MIAMHVRNKNLRDLTNFDITSQQLVLRCLATIEQPNFGTLR